MTKTAQEKGKEFEEEFRLYCKMLMEKHSAATHRFYDTHSAGTYLPNQPGDHLLVFKGHAYLWELKSSGEHNSLAANLSGLMAKEQATHLRLWSRAGATTHVLFRDQRSGVIELWDGKYVAETRHAKGARLDRSKCLRYGSILRFQGAFTDSLLKEYRIGDRHEDRNFY